MAKKEIMTEMTVKIKTMDLPEVKEMLSKLQSENELLKQTVKIYEKEIQRLYSETYKQPKVVAELLKSRAFIFTCSYKTVWENYMDDNEKYDFTYEEIIEYLDLVQRGRFTK